MRALIPTLLMLGLFSSGIQLEAQSPSTAALAERVQQLSAALAQTELQLRKDEAEAAALRQQMAELRASASASAPAAGVAALSQRVQRVEDRQAITAGQVATQEQTKVQSGSLFRVALSGLLLMNLYADTGAVENSDVPNLALAGGGGNVGASLRQSEVELHVEGPQIWGARASGSLIADFYGGFSGYRDATAAGLARLKLARGRLDWAHTALSFGLDVPLISPLTPTSYAALGTPALGFSGNLWTWTPQIAIEHRFPLGSIWSDSLQAGLLDPLTGEDPVRLTSRQPESGEASRQPAWAVRETVGRQRYGRDFSVGVGAYGSRQNYGFGRRLQAWALTGDWNLALLPRWDVSGEIYRGRGIGGLWGGLGRSIVAGGDLTDPATPITGLNAAGGWLQFKFHLSSILELNTTYGLDDSFTRDLLRFSSTAAPITRNRTALINLIAHPRSDLVFALEYRRLNTIRIAAPAVSADHLNAAVGVEF